MHPVVASSILRMPVIGQILQMLGAVKANPESVAKALQDGKSLALAPGTYNIFTLCFCFISSMFSSKVH
jgi:hypothetical protein